MGNSENNFSFPTFTSQQWITVTPPRRSLPGTPSLCKSSTDSIEADCYDITVHSTLQQQIDVLMHRKDISNTYILKLLDAKPKKRQMFQCNIKERLQIYTQKIICRLGDFSLTKKQALFLLKQTIESFSFLASFCKQYFIVSPQMIAFSSQGQVKIWLNQHFGYSQLKQENLARSQYQMIISIVKCFESYGIRVQDFYSFNKFEEILKHLNLRFNGLQLQQMKKLTIHKAIQSCIFENNTRQRSNSSQNNFNFALQRPESEEKKSIKIQHQFLRCSSVDKIPKENINPLKQINILEEFQNKRTPVYFYDRNSSREVSPQVFSTTKKSIKELTNSISNPSLKSIDISKKETSLSSSVSFSKKKVVEFSDSINTNEIQEFSEVPQSIKLKQIPLKKFNPIYQPSHLQPQLDVMSRITQRSHQDQSSCLGTERKAHLTEAQVEEDYIIRFSQDSRKPLEYQSVNTQDNYFTRIDL